MSLEQGRVHIYTGDGKGKTTAALGLVMRASGQGLRSFIAQFAKGMEYGELTALKRFEELVTIRQFGRTCFIRRRPTEEDRRLAREGWKEAKEALNGGRYDLMVLDEIGIALHYDLVSPQELKELIRSRPLKVELVLTGRKIPRSLYALADLVTEMREIKHYFRQGVTARKGIEY